MLCCLFAVVNSPQHEGQEVETIGSYDANVSDLLKPGQRYFMREFSPGIDGCPGVGHQMASLRCAMAEARALQRTFVLRSNYCFPGRCGADDTHH
jgi:hypothetical protein